MKINKILTRKISISISIGILICLVCTSLALAYPSVFPTGTTIYKPEKSYNSYILLTPYFSNGRINYSDDREDTMEMMREYYLPRNPVSLIDMNGNVAHSWEWISAKTRLLPNGHLLMLNCKRVDEKERRKTIVEVDWDSNIVWEYLAPTQIHHDLRRLPNGNTLVLCAEIVPKKYMEQVKDVEVPWWGIQKRSTLQLRGSVTYEVNPQGEVVWEWHEYKYLDLNKFSPVCEMMDWTHTNTIVTLPENHWYDEGDERFKPGNILLNPRNLDTVYIVDKDTKEIVWEWTHDYVGGLSHCHEPEMIEEDLPGAGDIILFDNGLFPRNRDHNGQSIIVELNPVTKEIVWKYETYGYSNIKFFSKTMGSQKRLPNGNTFISEDNTGRIFQVTPDGEVVWEYVSGAAVARVIPYSYNYCPEMIDLPRPTELSVTPPNNLEWHIRPDVERQY